MESNSAKILVRKPAVAGRFYPGNTIELKRNIENLFSEAQQRKETNLFVEDKIRALVVPHAGYLFSGIVAASAYKYLDKNKVFKNVFLIGSSHYAHLSGASVYNGDEYKTPLGNLKVNKDVIFELLKNSNFSFAPKAHEDEHSLEVQLPFLQYLWGNNFNIIPILIGTDNIKSIEDISIALNNYFTKDNLFIISTDLSHFPDYDDAYLIDHQTIKVVATGDKKLLLKHIEKTERKNVTNLSTCMCGWTSVYTLLSILEKNNKYSINPVLYSNSGDIELYGDKSRVVGYQSIVVSELAATFFDITNKEKKQLFKIVKESLLSYLNKTKRKINSEDIPEILKNKFGAFVSVYVNDELRGCIGSMRGDKPLYELLMDLVISASQNDSRFKNIDKDDFDNLSIEISVLSPLKKISGLDEFIPGKHGLYLKKDVQSGTYLPQVFEKTGWTVEEFFRHCAHDKAGLDWDEWKTAELYTYEAIVLKGT